MQQLPVWTRPRGARPDSRLWLAAAMLCFGLPLLAACAQGHAAPAPAARGVTAQSGWGRMPLYFVPNRGQMAGHADYYVPGQREQVYFDARGLTFALKGNSQFSEVSGRLLQHPASSPAHPASSPSLLTVAFRGARAVKPVGAADLGTRFSYFRGPKSKWKTGIPAFGALTYRNLWPGIDLAFRGTTDTLKYEFRVRPGADPAQIRLVYRGAKRVRVDGAGNLVAETPAGNVTDAAPVSYQGVSSVTELVESEWRVRNHASKTEASLRLGGYDHSRELVIDPATFVYCGYIGGSGGDLGYGIAVDSAGSAYVTGEAGSNPADGFPVSIGPALTYGGDNDAFVAKVRPDGTGLEYCGYIGGSGGDVGNGIAVDAAGSAYLTGYTFSSPADGFPVTVGPSMTFGYPIAAFVAKVRPDGSGLEYCGYIAGVTGDSAGNGIAVDAAGSAYVTGTTGSSPADGFPVTVGPSFLFDNAPSGSVGFVAKVNPGGTGFDYCGYVGVNDYGNAITVDVAGSAYVTGQADLTSADDFPVTVGPSLTFSGDADAFVAKVRPDGSGFEYCGYIYFENGGQTTWGTGIAADAAGSAYVAGRFNSGGDEGFVAKVSPDGAGLEYSDSIGGVSSPQGIAVDAAGSAYVTGAYTGNPTVFDSGAFVAKLSPDGSGFEYWVDTDGGGGGQGIAVDAAGSAYVTGYTASSPAGGFPVTVGPSLTYIGGGNYEAFVAKISYTASVVTAVATTPNASNSPEIAPGVFTVFSSPAPTTPLTVNYSVSGTAVPGTDYTALTGSVTIPAGQASATVTVTPLAGATSSVPLSVVLTVAAGTGYSVGAPVSDTVTITEPAPAVTVVATTPNASNAPVTPGIFTLSQSGNTSSALTVNYAVNGTAVPGADYTALTGTVTIPAGQSSATVSVTPLAGATASVPLTVVLTVAAGTGYVVGAPAGDTVSVTEPVPVVTVVATALNASNAPVTAGVFTVSQGGTASAAFMVGYSVSGTAVPGTDYTALSGSVTIPAGQSSVTVVVSPLAGATASVPLTVALTVTAGTGYSVGTPATDTVTITEPVPSVYVVATTPGASNSPVTSGVFTVSRPGNTSTVLTVNYAVGGTAVPGTDYTALSGIVTIPAGQGSGTVAVTPLAGATASVPLSVILTVTAGSGYTVGSPDSDTVTITEPVPSVTVVATTAGASNSPVTSGVFTVSRPGNTSTTLTVSYAVSGTAVPGADYTALSGSVTIPAGNSSGTVTVTPLAGATASLPLTVTLTLSVGPGYTPGTPGTATVSITEPVPSVTVIATTAGASSSPVTSGVFTVSRTGNTSAAITVNYSVTGTAVPEADYAPLTGSVTIPAGQASAIVMVTPLAGATAPVPPNVVLMLTAGTGYTVGAPGSGTVSISEPFPSVTVLATTPDTAKSLVTPGAFTVFRTGNTSSALTIAYTVGGTAVPGTDYSALSGSATILAGEASGTVTVTLLAASAATGTRTVILTLTGGTGYSIDTPGSATVTIEEGAAHAGKLSVAPTNLNFGTIKASAGPKRLAFTISNTGKGPLSVTVGPLAAPFSDNAPSGAFTLLPHGSQKVTVTYRPVKGVAASAKLAVTGGGATVNVALSGEGR